MAVGGGSTTGVLDFAESQVLERGSSVFTVNKDDSVLEYQCCSI